MHKSRWQRYLLYSFVALVVLIVTLVGTWFLVLRPPLHTIAEQQMGEILSTEMGHVNPALTTLIPAGIPLPLHEELINRTLVLPSSSWYSIQHLQLRVTPENVSTSFQVQTALGAFSSTVTSVPQVINGQVVIATMTVDGPLSLVMSPDEMKAEVNSYLAQFQARTHRSITALSLADHVLWLTFG